MPFPKICESECNTMREKFEFQPIPLYVPITVTPHTQMIAYEDENN